MNINQKGFNNIILIVLVVALASALGYVALVKKSSSVEQQQVNNSQNSQTITSPPSNSSVSQNPPRANSDKVLSELMPITFPSYCNFSINSEKVWNIDCGRSTKNDARGFMGKILESQGWRLCESGLTHAVWRKNGVVTGVTESLEDSDAVSYPFNLTQRIVETGDGYGECQ